MFIIFEYFKYQIDSPEKIIKLDLMCIGLCEWEFAFKSRMAEGESI